MHSASVPPPGAVFCGSATVSADDRIRSPDDSVSTCTLSICWHAPPFGAQTVTLTVGMFHVRCTPCATDTVATFDALACAAGGFVLPLPPVVPPLLLPVVLLLLLPPP